MTCFRAHKGNDFQIKDDIFKSQKEAVTNVWVGRKQWMSGQKGYVRSQKKVTRITIYMFRVRRKQWISDEIWCI